MRTAIDSNIISAIWSGEPSAPKIVAQLGEARLDGALLVSPVVIAELQAYPGATEDFVRDFLAVTGVTVDYGLKEEVWRETGRRFARYAGRRRKSSKADTKRLLADFLVGAHALIQADRLMTLDPERYERDFPEVRLC